jgi:type I restriction enzyme S subunit
MPKGEWKSVELGDVAEFVRGINFKPDDVVPTGTPGSVACMRTKNVQAELDLSDVWSVGEQFVRREDQFLQAGDILVSSANSWNLVGKCCWIPELPGRASFGGFVSVLRPHRAKVEPRFLFRWFSSDRIQTTLRSFGQQTTNISNLNTDRCLKLPLPLPPLAEQRRIAEVLDRAEALRAKRRAALAQLDSLTQAIFLDMFGDPAANPKSWLKKPLPDVCNCYSGGTPSKADPAAWRGDLPWFSAKDMKHDDLFDAQDHISRDVTERTTLRLLPAGTVAIVVRGMILAHTFPVCVLRVPAAVNQDLKALLPIDRIDPQFLAASLRCQAGFILQQVSEAGHGTKRLDSAGLRRILLPLPPLPLQHEFARRVTAVEALKTSHRASLTELDALFASLQHRAFRGEL